MSSSPITAVYLSDVCSKTIQRSHNWITSSNNLREMVNFTKLVGNQSLFIPCYKDFSWTFFIFATTTVVIGCEQKSIRICCHIWTLLVSLLRIFVLIHFLIPLVEVSMNNEWIPLGFWCDRTNMKAFMDGSFHLEWNPHNCRCYTDAACCSLHGFHVNYFGSFLIFIMNVEWLFHHWTFYLNYLFMLLFRNMRRIRVANSW